MPDWNFNPWTLSSWGAEPARDAARDTGRMGGGAATPSLEDVLQPPIAVKDPDPDDFSPADWYAYYAQDWPTVPNLIPLEMQVLGKDRERVKTWVNSTLAADAKRESVECFHFAKYQMDKKKYTISGPPALDSNSLLVIREYPDEKGGRVPEIWLNEAITAASYIKSSLLDGVPVMIGVKLDYYDDEPNNIYRTPYVIATDHFIVVVGSGVAKDGRPYINFYDYLEKYNSTDHKLYLTPLMIFESDVIGYKMIEMRRSYPR